LTNRKKINNAYISFQQISAHIQAKLSGDHGALACASVDGSIKQ
jgi:hypothetical protein